MGSMEYREIPLEAIRLDPTQPRKELGDLGPLVESIRAYGVLEPILVAEEGEGYRLLAGERRFHAAKMAGLKTIPAMVRGGGKEVALAENLARKEMDPAEVALGVLEAYSGKTGLPLEEARKELLRHLDRYARGEKDEIAQWVKSLGVAPGTLQKLLRFPFSLDFLKVLAGLGFSYRGLASLAQRKDLPALEDLVAKALSSPSPPDLDPMVRARFLLKYYLEPKRKRKRRGRGKQEKALQLLSQLLPLLEDLGYSPSRLAPLLALKDELQARPDA